MIKRKQRIAMRDLSTMAGEDRETVANAFDSAGSESDELCAAVLGIRRELEHALIDELADELAHGLLRYADPLRELRHPRSFESDMGQQVREGLPKDRCSGPLVDA